MPRKKRKSWPWLKSRFFARLERLILLNVIIMAFRICFFNIATLSLGPTASGRIPTGRKEGFLVCKSEIPLSVNVRLCEQYNGLSPNRISW